MNSFLHVVTVAAVLAALGPLGPDDDKVTANVAIAPANVSVTKSMSVSIYPSIDHAKVNLHVVNHVGRNLTISFLDNTGKRLASERVSGRTRSYHAKFNVEELTHGDYSILITDGTEKIIKSFHINDPQAVRPSRVMVLDENE